ncbi:GNAT family N-acetyltransferase [Aquipuribacter sp. MA13-6]|uniref:GNAT family N-acetyltransferase n=1 Tax=unclassified Aquipuribacter TaxID=2635084 RepID=UPI003EEA12DD
MSGLADLAIESPDVDGEDLVVWRNTFAGVFALPAATTEEVDAVRDTYRAHRLTGVRDDGRWVATFRSWPGDSAVPGGALTGHADAPRTLPTDLVSTVAVAPTHRRRGLLTRLMRDSLRHAADSGAVVSSLFASEAAIYGRYGFGVATRVHDLTVDTRAAAIWQAGAPVGAGRMRLSDDDELAAVGPALFDAARRRMPGAVGRGDIGWLRLLERVAPTPKPDGPRLRAVHLAPDGTVDGYVRLRLEMRWTDGAPRNKASVDDLVGATPEVLAALWRFCVDLDLVSTLVAEHRGHGELLPHLTADPRAVRVTSAVDGHWWRVLDPSAALAGRSWSGPGDVVLEVVDPDGPAAGRWEVSVGETGDAEVRRTTRTADVTLPVQSLPAVLTGVLDLPLLHAAGRLDEHTSGAVRRLEQMSRVSPVALGTVQGF